MSFPSLDSASGLRPIGAFVIITVVLGVVVGKATRITLAGGHGQPRHSAQEVLPAPDYDIVDREGRTLALSVRQLDLRASPRSLWQAHTPLRIAEKLAEAVGDPGYAELFLAALLPDADASGVIRVDPRALLLDDDARLRVELWMRGRDEQGAQVRPPIRGIETEEVAAGQWILRWEPAVLLSEAQRRARSGGDSQPVPLLWTRRIADDLARCLDPEGAVPLDGDPKALMRQRDGIWAALMPTAEHLVWPDMTATDAGKVLAVLDAEGVQLRQMRLAIRHARRYPVRSGEGTADAFEILGRWRYVDRPTALAMACAEMNLASVAHCSDVLLPKLHGRAGELLDQRHPASGLERLAGDLLTGPTWSFLAAAPATYRFRRDQPVHERARHYYFDEVPETEAPRVVSTIDAELQAWTMQVLEETIAESDAALAMAIVVDLATGDVLAVSGVSPYPIAEFLPTWHVFTPGSTFKAIVMAAALEEGAVRPDDTFKTYDGNYRIPGSGRGPIGEARGAPRGTVTAAEGLAHSVNAVLVQIGMGVRDTAFHGYLTKLGYGRVPGLGIGVERTTKLPPLPWKRDYEHASISFGHQLGVNLWQHAAGLAAVIADGQYRPLRLLREVRRDGLVWDLPLEPGDPVFSPATSRTVRGMMELGARIGTGRHLHAALQKAGTPLVFGSKTGTAEKVGTEVCLHNELWRNGENLERAARDEPPIPFAEVRAMPKPEHKSCYTSSICLYGRLEGSEREVMVFLVVEEPRGDAHYGSLVAGPPAMRLLQEALGLTREGERFALEVDAAGFAPSALEERNLDDMPWTAELPLAW